MGDVLWLYTSYYYEFELFNRATQSNYLQIRNIQVQFRPPNTESCTWKPQQRVIYMWPPTIGHLPLHWHTVNMRYQATRSSPTSYAQVLNMGYHPHGFTCHGCVGSLTGGQTCHNSYWIFMEFFSFGKVCGSGYGKENDKVYSDAPLGGTLADMW